MPDPATATHGAAVSPIPPPLYFAGGLALGMLLDRLAPLPIGRQPASTLAGAAGTAAGLALIGGGMVGVLGHHTTIVPHRPVATLVTTGAYRLSRNPIYTGLATAYLGATLLLDSWWPAALWPLAVLAVDRWVIRPEERYLGARFGRAYADYRARVRRWL